MKFNNRLVRYSVFFLGFASLTANAARICDGKIETVGVGKWGDVVYIHSEPLFGDKDGRRLCSIKEGTVYQNVTSKTCESWYSLLLAAQLGLSNVVLDYGEDNLEKGCHGRATWADYVVPIQIKIGVKQ